jgi:hypothetical protein
MATKKMLVSYATRNRSACCPRVSSQAHLAAQNVALEPWPAGTRSNCPSRRYPRPERR